MTNTYFHHASSTSAACASAAASATARQNRPTARTSRKRRLIKHVSLLNTTLFAAPAAITLLILLPTLPTTAHGFVTYREVLESHPHDTSNLPVPLSDLSVAFSMAPNVNGDLTTGIYLIGGCQSDYISYLNPHALDGVEIPPGKTQPKIQTQYRCAEVSPEVTFYDPASDWFSPRKPMDRPRHRHVAVGVSGTIWVVGGRDANDHVVPEVEVYDPGCEHWVTLGTLPPDAVVSDAAKFVNEEDLYIAGGYNELYVAQRTTIRIDTEATLKKNGSLCRLDGTGGGGQGVVWERVADMKTERAMPSGLSYGQFGYVLGGYTHVDGHCQPHNTVEIYNPKSNSWEYGRPLTNARAGAAVAKYKGRFFVVGGEKRGGTSFWGACPTDPFDVLVDRRHPRRKSEPVNSVEVYDPLDGVEGEWTKIYGGLPYDERYRFALASWPAKEQIYSFGGVTNRDYDGMSPCDDCLHVIHDIMAYKDNVERYETQTTWWGEFWVIISSITFTATVLGAIIGQIPALRLMVANWRGKGGASKSGKNGGGNRRSRGDMDSDDIALVNMGGGGPRRQRTDTEDLPRAEIL